MSNDDKLLHWLANHGPCICVLLDYAPAGQEPHWDLALRIPRFQLGYLRCKHVGWLAHAMLCVTGVPGSLEVGVLDEHGAPRWENARNEDVVLQQGVYRYTTKLDRT